MAGQALQDAGDDLRQQGLQLYGGGRTRLMEHRYALAATIDAVEHETMQMNIEIGGGAKALDEGDGTRVGFAAFESRLLDQKAGNHAVDDLQLRMSGKGMRSGIGNESIHWRTGIRGMR